LTSKNRWYSKLAHNTQKLQGSAQHFRTPWLQPSWDPEFLQKLAKTLLRIYLGGKGREFGCGIKSVKTPSKKLIGLLTSEPVIRTTGPRSTIYPCMSMPRSSQPGSVMLPADLERTDRAGKPLTPTHWIPLANVQQSRAELPYLRTGKLLAHCLRTQILAFIKRKNTKRHPVMVGSLTTPTSSHLREPQKIGPRVNG